MVMLTLFVFDWKYHFQINLVEKIKVVIGSRNLATRLTRICRIQWSYSLFLFWTEGTVFGQTW